MGLVTYIRTDSTRISEGAQNEALEYILSKYGKEFRPGKPNQYRAERGLRMLTRP